MSDIQLSTSGMSPREFAAVFFRQKWAIGAFYLIVLLTVATYCFFWPPTYEAGVRFVVKNDRQEQIMTADQDGVRMVTRQPVTEDDLPPGWMKRELVVPEDFECSCC